MATTNSSVRAGCVLEAWEKGSIQRLESELHQISRMSGQKQMNSTESERLEFLEEITKEMARMAETGYGSRDAADLYCGLLRHLSSGRFAN